MNQIMLFISLLVMSCSQNRNTENPKITQSMSEKDMSIDSLQIVKEIDKKIERIENDKQRYGKVEQDIFGKSSEGGVIMSYYEGSLLKKVKVTYYGEMGNATFEYYVDEDNVIYIKKEQVSYDKPMYFDDSKIASVEESKYYFLNQQFLLWKDHQGKVIRPRLNQFKKESEQMLADFNELKNQLGNYNPPSATSPTGDTVRCKYGSRCQDSGYIIKGSRLKGSVIHVKPPLNKDVPMEQE